MLYNTLIKLPATKCTDTSHAGLRVWYTTVTRTMQDQGVYVHPFNCFRKDVGGFWGFDYNKTPGSGNGMDLPYSLKDVLPAMSNAVHQHISKTGTFTANSEFSKIIKNCPGDGFRALKLIIMRVHPNFTDEPASYMAEYPKQNKDETVFDFSLRFEDFLWLQAFIMDTVCDFGDTKTQDIFLARCYYSNWIRKRTYEERKRKLHLYTNEMFINTSTVSIGFS